MTKKFIILTVLLLYGYIAAAQNTTVSGQYLDKKSNPFAGALVSYYTSGNLLLDTTRTLVDGTFQLSLDLTGLNLRRVSGDPFITLPHPNPFDGLCTFTLAVDKSADIVITGMQGFTVDRYRIKRRGVYRCVWGGKNSIGQDLPAGNYTVTVTGGNTKTSRKIIFSGNAVQRLTVIRTAAAQGFKNGGKEQDRINFQKEKTSELDIFVNTPSGDTTVGIITGNAGPNAVSNIISTVPISGTNTWNLNNYFYNDDQSIYQTTDTNFVISDDSIMTFTGNQTGTYNFLVIATDAYDAILSDTVSSEIEVTDAPMIILSGTYLDRKNNPLAAADVVYYQNGNTNIGQTVTAADGYFELAVAVSKNTKSYDELEFTKTNTTTLDIWMNTPQADTGLGNIIGNTGPENTQTLIANVHIDSLVNWNLNDYFYNDDQSQYTVDDTLNFGIEQDSMLAFTGNAPGNYTPLITATDTADNTLTALMTAQITIRNEQHINVAGTYSDKAANPIVNALVTYYEDTTNLINQTYTTGSGFYGMIVTVLPGHSGRLVFTKTNTTELQKDFPTPQGDTVIDATGNIGPETLNNIDETRFTIEAPLIWNLNNYFTNDDQSLYTQPDTCFAIVDDTLLRHEGDTGTYATTVTATDPQDTTLTAQMSVDLNVQYTINIPDTSIVEDYSCDTLFSNLNLYVNPNYPYSLTYAVISQSNDTLIDLYAQDSAILINYLQPDSAGNSCVGVQITGNGNIDTVYFTVTVNAMPDVSGYVTNVLDTLNTGIAGVVVELTLDSIHFYRDTTDAGGYYKIQLPDTAQTVYYHANLSKTGYITFHSWVTLDADSSNVTKDFTLTDDNFPWELYNRAFRSTTGLDAGPFPFSMSKTTRHWLTPPPIHVYSDNSAVGGYDITVQYNNLIYNLNNILPTFNPRDALPSNIVEHEHFSDYTPQDGDMATYFDDGIGAAGVASIIYDGPQILKASAIFAHNIGNTGADNKVFNQELGTCFGAVVEPPQSNNYVSVFTDPTYVNTYTDDDYDCATLMLDRARVHYRNLSYDQSDPEGWDWEMRPDEVLTWYPGTSKKTSGKRFAYKIFGWHGEVVESGDYAIDEVPLRIMKVAKWMFTPEQIEAGKKRRDKKQETR